MIEEGIPGPPMLSPSPLAPFGPQVHVWLQSLDNGGLQREEAKISALAAWGMQPLDVHKEHAWLAFCHTGPRRCLVQGDCLQQLGDSIIESCASLPDAELTAEVEADGRKNAGAVFKRAVQAYRKVGTCCCCRAHPS